MKTMILAAVAALSLGTGAAYAAGGLPVGYQEPVYGSQAFSDHHNEPVVHFLGKDTVLGKLFNHSNSDQAVVNTAAVNAARGG